MLTRAEIAFRLGIAIPPDMTPYERILLEAERQALETAQQLAEWLEMFAVLTLLNGLGNGEMATAARAWLEGSK